MPARPARVAWLAAAAFAAWAMTPAAAGSQSSNSSSNCSNGRCTRVESYGTERGGFHRGWTRIDRWDERRNPYRGARPWRGYDRHHRDDPHRRGGDLDG